MKATEIHYNTDTGVVTAHQNGDRKRTVTENCTGVDLVAGDDVSVRIDAKMVHVETLTEEPLLVREKKDGGELEVLTTRRPDRETPVHESKPRR